MSKKEAEEGAIQGAKGLAAASGRTNGMSGRDLFTFQSHLLENSDDEDGDEEDEFEVHLARVRAEAKARSEEIERNRQMDRDFGGMSLRNDEANGEEAAETTAEAADAAEAK